MAKEFVMGARLELNDDFSKGMGDAAKATMDFKKSVTQTTNTMGSYRDSAGRLRDANGKYIKDTTKASGSTDKLNNSTKKAKGSQKGFWNALKNSTNGMKKQNQQAKSLSDRVFSLKGAFAALAGSMAIKGGFDWLVGANADMEQYQNTLSVVLGSQEKAVEQMAWAEKFAAKTPFEIPGIIEATTRLESYGIASKDVLGITGDMASVMGKDLMQAVEAVADAQTGELERMKEFGITKKMIEEQAKAMGNVAFDNSGAVKSQEALNDAMFALMQDRFKGGMELQSKTFKGMISNVQDTVGSMGRALGKPLFEKMKVGLQGFLGWLNKLQSSGAIDAFIVNVQKVGGFVWSVFSTIGSFIGTTISNIALQFQGFYTQNKPAIDGIKNGLMLAFTTLSTYAKPILIWLRDVGLPAIAKGVSTFAGWILTAANWFITKWALFKPFIMGLVIAWGSYIAITKTVQAVTKAWTMAQMALNAVMNMNPIGLIITLIGLLIGAGILIVQNWDVIKAKAGELWTWLKAKFNAIKTAIVDSFAKAWTAVSAKFTEFIDGALEFGSNFIKTIADGILSAKDWLVDKVKGVFDAVRNLLPFSDAKTGPFSDLTASGEALLKTIGKGILNAKDWLVGKVKGVFDKVRDLLPFSDAKTGPFSQLTMNGGKIISTLAAGVGKKAGMLKKAVNGAVGEANPTIGVKAGTANPSGITKSQTVSKKVLIDKLIEKIEIHGAESKNVKELVQEIINELYDRLKDVDEILSAAGMGELLHD